MTKRTVLRVVGVTLLLAVWTAPAVARAQDDVRAAGPGGVAGADSERWVEVPLRLEGGRMIVEVRTRGGEALDFAVSTGNSVLVLSASASARLGSEPALTLGGVPVVTEGAQVRPDESLATASATLAGMIGANTLSHYDVLFDAPGGRLVLAETGTSVSWPGYDLSDPVPLRVYHGTVLGLDVTVDGVEYMAGLDLGSRRMLVSEPLAAAAGLEKEDAVTLALGSVAFPAVPTLTMDHPAFAMWDPTGRGFLYVGSAIVEGCPLAVSWAHRELRTCLR